MANYHPPCELKTSHHWGVYQSGHQRAGWLGDAEKQNLLTFLIRSFRRFDSRSVTFFLTLVPDGNGVVAEGHTLSVYDVHSQTQELGGGDQVTLVGEHIQPSTIHKQEMSVGGQGRTKRGRGISACLQRSRKGWWENERSSSTDFKRETAIIKATTYLTGVIKLSSDFRAACNWSTAAPLQVSRSLHRSVAQELLYINLISANGLTRPQSMMEQDGADRSRVCAVMKH